MKTGKLSLVIIIFLLIIILIVGLTYYLYKIGNIKQTSLNKEYAQNTESKDNQTTLYYSNEYDLGKLFYIWNNENVSASIYFKPNAQGKNIKIFGPIYFEGFKNPQFSPDRKKVIFALGLGGDAYGFYVSSLDGSGTQKLNLTYKCCYGYLSHLNWIDNEYVIIKDYTYKDDKKPETTIYWKVDVNTSEIRKITSL